MLAIPFFSPFEPLSYLVAFVIVVGISMVKDAIEDYKRHVNDKEVNEKQCYVIAKKTKPENNLKNSDPFDGMDEDLEIQEKLVMGISSGDWLLLKRNEEIPVDVVILGALKYKDDSVVCCNHCYVETSNLDGESNLKKRTSPEHENCPKDNFVYK